MMTIIIINKKVYYMAKLMSGCAASYKFLALSCSHTPVKLRILSQHNGSVVKSRIVLPKVKIISLIMIRCHIIHIFINTLHDQNVQLQTVKRKRTLCTVFSSSWPDGVHIVFRDRASHEAQLNEGLGTPLLHHIAGQWGWAQHRGEVAVTQLVVNLSHTTADKVTSRNLAPLNSYCPIPHHSTRAV